jgi:DnaJ-class molecular chaperone
MTEKEVQRMIEMSESRMREERLIEQKIHDNPCPKCDGRGYWYTSMSTRVSCKTCSGRGYWYGTIGEAFKIKNPYD